jgi:hypothetical protein
MTITSTHRDPLNCTVEECVCPCPMSLFGSFLEAGMSHAAIARLAFLLDGFDGVAVGHRCGPRMVQLEDVAPILTGRWPTEMMCGGDWIGDG